MTKVTKESLAARIAELESGARSLKEDYTLAAYKMLLATLEAEPVRNPVLAYADSYRDMAKQGVESVPIWSVITDLERNIAPLYIHAPPVPGVPECFYNAVAALESLYRNGQKQCWNVRYTTDMAYASGVLNACRAVMLNGGKP